MITRIYIVTEIIDGVPKQRLVMATSAAQAVSHVVKPRFSAQAASPMDVAILMKDGAELETASNKGE